MGRPAAARRRLRDRDGLSVTAWRLLADAWQRNNSNPVRSFGFARSDLESIFGGHVESLACGAAPVGQIGLN